MNSSQDMQQGQSDYVIDMSAYENQGNNGGAPLATVGRGNQQSNVFVAGGIVGAPLHAGPGAGVIPGSGVPIYSKSVSEQAEYEIKANFAFGQAVEKAAELQT